MAYTPDSYATTPRGGDDSPPASPASFASPYPAGIPSLSETRVKDVCYKCGDPGYVQVDEGDGAAEAWLCKDCDLFEPESCEHCEEAARLGKAAVCGCEKIKPPKKKMKIYVPLTPPTTPRSYMDESE